LLFKNRSNRSNSKVSGGLGPSMEDSCPSLF
jgi:hypothetical protein